MWVKSGARPARALALSALPSDERPRSSRGAYKAGLSSPTPVRRSEQKTLSTPFEQNGLQVLGSAAAATKQNRTRAQCSHSRHK